MDVIEPARRQIRQRLLVRDELVAPPRVTLAGQSLEKLFVVISAGPSGRGNACETRDPPRGCCEVIQHVRERLAGDRDAERVHAGEVRGPQAARVVSLSKYHFLIWATRPTPVTNPTLERAPL